MLSNLCELLGMAAITYGTWVLAGRGVAAVVGGVLALVVGLALDGVQFPKVKLPKFLRRET